MARVKLFTHDEWHYTGNSPNGKNVIFQDGLNPLMEYVGAENEDPLTFLAPLHLGDKVMTYKKFRISIRSEVLKDVNSFGYQTVTTYRVEQV